MSLKKNSTYNATSETLGADYATLITLSSGNCKCLSKSTGKEVVQKALLLFESLIQL